MNNDNEQVWSGWRQDDNGNEFRIEAGLSEFDARSIVEEFERRGHKQICWVRKEER